MTIFQQSLIAYYLSYTNDYLTLARYAEDLGISIEFARAILKEGKHLHELKVELLR